MGGLPGRSLLHNVLARYFIYSNSVLLSHLCVVTKEPLDAHGPVKVCVANVLPPFHNVSLFHV